ncbi:MAG: SLBB domain-containing protein [Deltaproteobacteria bacterium]|nr:SLBB domain-containing protein [Deltaproteobacteria bacterium]
MGRRSVLGLALVLTLAAAGLAAGAALPPGVQIPPGTQLPPGVQLPPGFKLPPGVGVPQERKPAPPPPQVQAAEPAKAQPSAEKSEPSGAAQKPPPAAAAPASAPAPKPEPPPPPPPPKPEPPADLSAIERGITPERVTVDTAKPEPFSVGQLRQFGYSFFKTPSPGFTPATDVPVSLDYLVGPGDRLTVNLWGSVEGTYDLEVNRSGEIILPRVGSIKVWGVPYGNLQELVRSQLAKVYKDFSLNVNLGKLRLIKVFVVGEVVSPGSYDVSALSTVIHALQAAGGPTKTGTMRSIQVRREGKLLETVDLYDFFLRGEKSRDIRLQAGDTLFVPTIGKVAGVGGNVLRPAIFELGPQDTLKELLELGGGLVPTGYLQRVQVYRVTPYEKNVITDLNLDPKASGQDLDKTTSSVAIQDMDVVTIFPIDRLLRGYVRLEGHVVRPGDYALKAGMRLKDLLPDLDLLPEYHPETLQVTRYYAPDYHPQVLFLNFRKILSGEADQNLELQEFDRVRVFSRWQLQEMPRFTVSGEVQKPGNYRLMDGMTVRDAVNEAGGLKLSAFGKTAELIRIRRTGQSREAFRVQVDLDQALKGGGEQNLVLAPEDELIVRGAPLVPDEPYTVSVAGDVHRPGQYRLYPHMRLSDLVTEAGGLKLTASRKTAELVRIRRTGQSREAYRIEVNLEQALKGASEQNLALAHEDELVVREAPLVPDEVYVVSVAGEVRKPGQYRLYPNMRVSDLVTEAGGPVPLRAYLKDAEVTRIRIEGDAARSSPIHIRLDEALKGNPQDNILLAPHDNLIVRTVPDWMEEKTRFVTLKGEFRFPGTYPISKGERLSSVMERAGGFTEKAYLRAAKFTRASVQAEQQERMEEVIKRSEQEIAHREARLTAVASSPEELQATQASLQMLMLSLEKLKAAKAEGRLVIRLTPLDRFKGSSYDVELQGGDALEVPQSSAAVTVLGEVYNPTTVLSMPGRNVDYYLQKAGGPTVEAEAKEIYVVRADGSLQSRRQAYFEKENGARVKRGWFSDPFMGLRLDAGDTVVVPRKIEKIAWMREIKDVMQIIANAALTAGVVIAAGL